MDRYQQLDEKRRGPEGLTADEADELGRLQAERDGKPYEGNADNPPPEVAAERDEGEVEGGNGEEIDENLASWRNPRNITSGTAPSSSKR